MRVHEPTALSLVVYLLVTRMHALLLDVAVTHRYT